MSNFVQDILEVVQDETIEGIVIGSGGWDYRFGYEDADTKMPYGLQCTEKQWEDQQKVIGKVISWEEAIPLLSYSYTAGYGSPGCNAITAWTANLVIFVVQYDGSTYIMSVPRNPTDHIPAMPGGG